MWPPWAGAFSPRLCFGCLSGRRTTSLEPQAIFLQRLAVSPCLHRTRIRPAKPPGPPFFPPVPGGPGHPCCLGVSVKSRRCKDIHADPAPLPSRPMHSGIAHDAGMLMTRILCTQAFPPSGCLCVRKPPPTASERFAETTLLQALPPSAVPSGAPLRQPPKPPRVRSPSGC